jgi:hypothetical protein
VLSSEDETPLRLIRRDLVSYSAAGARGGTRSTVSGAANPGLMVDLPDALDLTDLAFDSSGNLWLAGSGSHRDAIEISQQATSLISNLAASNAAKALLRLCRMSKINGCSLNAYPTGLIPGWRKHTHARRTAWPLL